MSRINETRHITWYETCKYVCRLTSSVCNSRQIWNKDKYRCECREDLIDNMIKDLFGILAIASAYAINHVALENIWIIKIVFAEIL